MNVIEDFGMRIVMGFAAAFFLLGTVGGLEVGTIDLPNACFTAAFGMICAGLAVIEHDLF